MQLDLKSTSKKLLYLFLVTDIAFIIIHLIHVYSDTLSNVYFSLAQNRRYAEIFEYIKEPYFSLERDRGYAEIFQYIKEYWIAILLGVIAVKKRSIFYLSWFLLFVYLLFDDSLAIHEKLGVLISDKLGLSEALNLRARDFGELLVSGFFGLFFLILIGTAYRFGDSAFRKASRVLIKMLLALVFCGIVVDMAHIAVGSRSLDPILATLEDGGEMIVMSIIAWFVFLLSDDTSSSSTNTNALEEQFIPHRTEVASRPKF